jgi:hypothetical protein
MTAPPVLINTHGGSSHNGAASAPLQECENERERVRVSESTPQQCENEREKERVSESTPQQWHNERKAAIATPPPD